MTTMIGTGLSATPIASGRSCPIAWPTRGAGCQIRAVTLVATRSGLLAGRWADRSAHVYHLSEMLRLVSVAYSEC